MQCGRSDVRRYGSVLHVGVSSIGRVQSVGHVLAWRVGLGRIGRVCGVSLGSVCITVSGRIRRRMAVAGVGVAAVAAMDTTVVPQTRAGSRIGRAVVTAIHRPFQTRVLGGALGRRGIVVASGLREHEEQAAGQ